MKQALITGGTGFIGTNLTEFLLEETEWNIKIMDNSPERFERIQGLENFDGQRVIFLESDIRNEEDVKEGVKGCEYIVSLAAQVGVVPSVEDPGYDAEVNIMGLINLLEAARAEDIEKFVHASSAAPLGEVEPPVSEDDVPRPLSPYGASKLAGEGYCSAYAGSFDMNAMALRFSNVYGPYSGHKESVVHKFIRKILRNRKLVIYGDGEQTRDYIYTEDLCRGIYQTITKQSEGFELIQLGSGEETSVNELVRMLEEVAEKFDIDFPQVLHEDEREGEIRRNYTDISKARQFLDFEPETDLKEGLKETFEWYLNNEDKV